MYWDSLSERSKSAWFLQHPGKEIDPNIKPSQLIPTNLYKPKSFVVLEFEIYSVDLLKIITPIHKRFIWNKTNSWKKIEVNP